MLTSQKKTSPPELYPTPYNGRKIINAVTGLPYSFSVGSLAQNQVFKTSFVNGNLTSKGYFVRPGTINKDAPFNAYFDSPKQYERFFEVKLDKAVVNRWNRKKGGGSQPLKRASSI